MKIKVISQPAKEPVSLEEARTKLRLDEEEEATITSLIQQAREWCEDYQGKKYITQTLEAYLDGFPANEIEFRYVSPVQDIEYIKYTDAHGEETEIAETDYILDNISFVNKIVPATNKRWPCVRLKPINGIKIRFVAGYENEEDVPQSVKWAMILQMKLLYEDYKPEQRKALETARDNLLGTKRVVPA